MPPQRARDSGHKPLGFAAIAGVLAEWDTIDEDMAEVIKARVLAVDRSAPELP